MSIKPFPEQTLLAPRDPSLDDNSDAWPEITLSNVSVQLPDDPDTQVNLLHASAYYPLALTATLDNLPKAQEHLRCAKSTRRNPPITVTDIKSFSYGQYANGDVGIWAAGKAGWHLIKPSRAYRPMYNQMVDAVKTLYFIADVYRESQRSGKGKGKTPSPELCSEQLFERFAAELGDSSQSVTLAEERICEHREFLFASMIAGKEGLDWGKNPLYQHLCTKYPRDHQIVAERVLGSAAKPTKSIASHPRQQSESSDTSSLKRKRGRLPKDRALDVISIGSSSVASSAREREISSFYKGRAHRASLAASKASRRTQHTSDSASVCIAETPELPSDVRQHRGRYYSRFTDCHCGTKGFAYLGKMNSHIRREHGASSVHSPWHDQTAAPVADREDEPPVSRAQKGHSALRPKPSKGSKGTSRSGKIPLTIADEDSVGDLHAPTWPIAAGKRKSNAPPLDDRQRKRRNSKQDLDEGIDMASSPAPSDSNSLTPDAAAGAAEELSLDLAFRLKHNSEPVQENTWVCALDGCTHKVYFASQPDSQRLIKEHYALHAYDDDERVQMVKRLQEPSLPVNHLMERVRLQAKAEGLPSSRYAGMGMGGANEVSRFPALPVLRY